MILTLMMMMLTTTAVMDKKKPPHFLFYSRVRNGKIAFSIVFFFFIGDCLIYSITRYY